MSTTGCSCALKHRLFWTGPVLNGHTLSTLARGTQHTTRGTGYRITRFQGLQATANIIQKERHPCARPLPVQMLMFSPGAHSWSVRECASRPGSLCMIHAFGVRKIGHPCAGTLAAGHAPRPAQHHQPVHASRPRMARHHQPCRAAAAVAPRGGAAQHEGTDGGRDVPLSVSVGLRC
eukprot:scaffold48696_cov20-Tisochrysis_lutea.AAC.4